MPLFQNESWCKIEFDLRENEPTGPGREDTFSYVFEWFRTKTHFDTKPKVNPEMAYFELIFGKLIC